LMQFFFNLLWQDGTAAAAEDADMRATVLVQQVFHVFEKFDMSALVAGNGDALYIFFNSAFYDFEHAAVVSEVNDLGTFALQDAAHDINGGIVAIE